MADKQPNTVHNWAGDHREARVKAETFWLELVDLRRLLAAVEDLPDNADVTFEGITESYTYVGERYAKEAHVRHQKLERRL